MKKKERSILSEEQIQELAAELRESRRLTGDGGVFTPLLKQVIEASLEGEMDHHMDRTRSSGNRRNGHGKKTLRTSVGEVPLTSPRDRDGSFSPVTVPKRSRELGGEVDQKILSLLSMGMSYQDVQSHLKELYGVEISTGSISAITERLWPIIDQWRSRPLEDMYPVIWLDAIHFKVRGQSGRVEPRAVYSILGVTAEGEKQVLGFYMDQSESSSFWRIVLAELRERGVQDILIACVDGLKGFVEAIEDEFPKTEVQACVIHEIRNTMKYVPNKDAKAFLRDLKKVYTAVSAQEAALELDRISQQWGARFDRPLKGWIEKFDLLTAFMKYPPALRRIIYTTNPIESFHRQARKVTKTKGAFTDEKAVIKLLYLVCERANHKWNGTMYGWNSVRTALAEHFDNRFTNPDTLC